MTLHSCNLLHDPSTSGEILSVYRAEQAHEAPTGWMPNQPAPYLNSKPIPKPTPHPNPNPKPDTKFKPSHQALQEAPARLTRAYIR